MLGRAFVGYGSATSQRETAYGVPAGPPTMRIAVSSAVARACADQRRVAHEDDRPGRRVDLLAVDREDRVPGHDDEEFLVAVRLVLLVVGLVMRLDHLVAGVSGRGVDAERLDVEVPPDQMERRSH